VHRQETIDTTVLSPCGGDSLFFICVVMHKQASRVTHFERCDMGNKLVNGCVTNSESSNS